MIRRERTSDEVTQAQVRHLIDVHGMSRGYAILLIAELQLIAEHRWVPVVPMTYDPDINQLVPADVEPFHVDVDDLMPRRGRDAS